MANQYDFITNPGQPTQKAALKLPGGKITLIAGFGVLGVIVLLVVMNLLFGGGGSRENLLKAVQTQHELVRVTSLSVMNDTAQDTKNIVQNTQVSIRSAQSRLVAALGERGIRFSDQDIRLAEDPSTNTALETARTAGMLDETVRSTIKTQLTAYAGTLNTAHSSVQTQSVKDLLAELFREADLLLRSLN